MKYYKAIRHWISTAEDETFFIFQIDDLIYKWKKNSIDDNEGWEKWDQASNPCLYSTVLKIEMDRQFDCYYSLEEVTEEQMTAMIIWNKLRGSHDQR